MVDKPAAVASHPTINDISWIKAFVSRALAELDRRRESLAWRHGCVERCTFGGRDMDAMVKIAEKEAGYEKASISSSECKENKYFYFHSACLEVERF